MTTLTKLQSKTYANPSWTMAIASQPSALSRWWGQSLSRVSGFTLQLKVHEESEIEDADQTRREQDQPVVIQGTQSQLEGFAQVTEQYVQSWLGRAVMMPDPEDEAEPLSAFWDDAPEWQSESGYSHRLSLGALQVEPILRGLTVTTTQLYDLAEILQESVAHVQPLSAGHFARTLPERSPAWGKTAAVAAIALSVTSGAAWFLGGGTVLQTASEPEPEDRISLNAPQSSNPSAEPPLNVPLDIPVKPVKPPTSDKKSSKTTIAKQVDPSQSKETTVKANTESVETAIAQQKLSKSSAANGEGKTEAAKTVTVPDQKTSTSTAKKPAPAAPTSGNVSRQDALGDAPAKAPSPSPTSTAESSKTAEAIAQVPPAPSTLDQLAAEQSPSVSEPLAAASGRTANAPAALEAPAASDFSVAGKQRQPTAVSTAPVLRFFQSQWQGQDTLAQSLVYVIVVDPDGSVRSVTPQNEIASTQFAQTPLPRPGDPLVPPFSGESAATFNVTLFPDGTVSVK